MIEAPVEQNPTKKEEERNEIQAVNLERSRGLGDPYPKKRWEA